MDITIRSSRPEDSEAIRQIHLAAFDNSPYEADLVEKLHDAGIAPISIVAVRENGTNADEEEIVGHALFSIVTLDPPHPRFQALGLAPIGVLPQYQGEGIGAALIKEGLYLTLIFGYHIVVVLGDPTYYGQFGFKPANQFGFQNEFDADKNFMAVSLSKNGFPKIKGTVQYGPQFRETVEG